MSKLLPGGVLPKLGLLGLMGLAVGLVLARGAGLELSPALRWGVFVVSLVIAVWLTLAYWRQIDEAAREAQKSAWFWGSGSGAILGFAAVTALAMRDPALGGWVAPDAPAAVLVQAGAIAVLASQLVGFFIAWAIWWWRMR